MENLDLCTIMLQLAVSGESLGSVQIQKTACVGNLRSHVQSLLGHSLIKLFHGDCVLHHDDVQLSEVGILDGSQILVLLVPSPDGAFQAEYEGNGIRPEGPYRAGYNYTATATASFDGMGKCLMSIVEEGGIAGALGGEYECVVSFIEGNAFRIEAVRERTWDFGSDGEWHESVGKCFLCVVNPDQAYIILDLSVLHGFGPECRLSCVAVVVPDGAKDVEASKL